MYCVGLTGSIASGKSTVAALFAQLGVDVIYSDHIAKQLTAKGQPALADIIAHFGPVFLNSDGQLHRHLLRDYIFKYPAERLWLENLLHPLIRKSITAQLQQPARLYYLIEIPLLFKKKSHPYLNRVLTVVSDPNSQIQRIMERDHLNEQQAITILQTQASTEAYQLLADDIIVNSGSLADIEQSVVNLHHYYLDTIKRNNLYHPEHSD